MTLYFSQSGKTGQHTHFTITSVKGTGNKLRHSRSTLNMDNLVDAKGYENASDKT